MALQRRYLEAVLQVQQHGSRTHELAPSVLAAAAVAVLPVTAAGISLIQGKLRVPLAWTDEHAAIAERQQTTLGDGPCLTAAATGRAVLADADDIARRWPAYCLELERRTPFRSVAALPLRPTGQPPLAALDLYADRPDLGSILRFDDAEAVAGLAADLLFGVLEGLYDNEELTLPAWIDDQPALDRVAVWTAVGMMIAAADLDDDTALARLRSFASRNGLTLDQAAAGLVDRRVPLNAVLTGPPFGPPAG